jgi:hypothetical protein
VHVLSGPFHVEGAEPGDLLVVDILEIDACDQEDEGPFSGMGWGYTGAFAKSNGGGFLTDRFPDAYKVIWDFRGDVATSRHIPECSPSDDGAQPPRQVVQRQVGAPVDPHPAELGAFGLERLGADRWHEPGEVPAVLAARPRARKAYPRKVKEVCSCSARRRPSMQYSACRRVLQCTIASSA